MQPRSSWTGTSSSGSSCPSAKPTTTITPPRRPTAKSNGSTARRHGAGFRDHRSCDTRLRVLPSPELKQEINELIRLYRKIDHVAIKAQIHAVLFTTRGILRWYEQERNPEHLAFAEDLYRRYRHLAMTEDYENYNWFGTSESTEGCAIVDSFTVAIRLWRLTGKTEYLEDAQLILFNGLLANQKDGDFGINNCVGPNHQLFLKDGGPAPWCCSVWGGKGLARAFQYSYFLRPDGLMVTIPGNSTVTARLPKGLLTLKQTTGYPHENGCALKSWPANPDGNARSPSSCLPGSSARVSL